MGTTTDIVSRYGIMCCAGILLLAFAGSGYCQDNGYALMLQHTPVGGGNVDPVSGVHNFSANSVVTITAVPKPGYQFVQWLGDVSEPTTQSTTIVLDGPRIVIAVFERSEFDLLKESDYIPAGSGPGGLVRSSPEIAMGGPGSAIYGGNDGNHRSNGYSPISPEDVNKDFPVPDGTTGDDFPVPDGEKVPEPGTIGLLAFGIIPAFVRRRNQKKVVR